MVKQRQVLKQQTLREAEGYLELLQLGGFSQPTTSTRELLGNRAIDTLDRIADYGTWSAHACYLRGQAYRFMGRYDDAIIPLKASAELERNNMSVWLALGWCYKRSGRLDLAIESLEEGLTIAPDHAILYYNLACYWSLARHVQHAVHYLSRAFDLDSHYRDLVGSEVDFDPIRDNPHFQAINTVIV